MHHIYVHPIIHVCKQSMCHGAGSCERFEESKGHKKRMLGDGPINSKGSMRYFLSAFEARIRDCSNPAEKIKFGASIL